jgi:hypothetical protein
MTIARLTITRLTIARLTIARLNVARLNVAVLGVHRRISKATTTFRIIVFLLIDCIEKLLERHLYRDDSPMWMGRREVAIHVAPALVGDGTSINGASIRGDVLVGKHDENIK